jgi:hypothetical protein
MTSDAPDHILRLLTEALDEIDTVPVSTSVRRAWRIARLQGDELESLRFAMEFGVEGMTDESHAADGQTLRAVAWALVIEGRTINVEARLLGVGSVEDLTIRPLEDLELLQAPNAVEAEFSLQTRTEHENRRSIIGQVLNRLKAFTLRYLIDSEARVRLEVSGEQIFQRHRRQVDGLLHSLAPEILNQLNTAIQRSVESDNSESCSQALLSCRRVLEAVANVVYPPSSEPHIDKSGNERNVGATQYKNRLIAFVENSSEGTHSLALTASVIDFANRLDALDDLTQKGVHAMASAIDVEFGVIQTYILTGEVLTLRATAR